MFNTVTITMRCKSVFLIALLLSTFGGVASGQTIHIDENKLFPGDHATCGVNCVYMLLKLHDVPVTLKEVFRVVPCDRKRGSTLLQLKDGLKQFGFTCKGLQMDVDQLGRIQLPAIAHLKKEHFVLILSVEDSKVRIADPPAVYREMEIEDFAKDWSGVVLICEPPAKPQTRPESAGSTDRPYAGEPVWNLGTCPSGNIYRHTFELINPTPKELKILRVASGCGCTVVRPADSRIPPRGRITVDVKLETAGRKGPYKGTIRLTTDHDIYPTCEMKIEGDFVLKDGLLGAVPVRLAWGEIIHGQRSDARKLTIIRQGNEPLTILGTKASLPHIHAVQIAQKGDPAAEKGTLFEVWVDESMPLGQFSGVLTVETAHDSHPTIEIPFSGKVVGDIECRPSTFLLHANSSGRTASILLRSRQGRPFNIDSPRFELEGCTGQVAATKLDAQSWRISLTLHDPLPGGIVKGQMRVTTNAPDDREIVIPVIVAGLE